MFEVIEPGVMTTVQDLGRPGYASMGIPLSGAADTFSLKAGNLIVGNDVGEAGLEVVLYGLQLRVMAGMMISVTGADFGPTLNNEKIPMWRALEVEKGDLISFPSFKLSSKKGCRTYLTVAGGIDVPSVLGSKSTCLPGNFGGFQGRALRKGDQVKVRRSTFPYGELRNRRFDGQRIPSFEEKWKIRVILGPNDHLFTEDSLRMLLSQDWRVSYKASRFGLRYIGPKLEYKPRPPHQVLRDPKGDPSNIPTQGVPLGAMEVTGGEEVIAIGVDGPSITGFTIIAVIASADMWKIGQSKPDEIAYFQKIGVEEAYQLLAESKKLIQENNILTK